MQASLQDFLKFMIILENSLELGGILFKKLPAVAATLSPGSVRTYLLLEQLTDEYLYLSAYGIDGIWSKWRIRSTATPIGTQMLIPIQELKDCLNNLNSSYGIMFKSTAKGIVVKTFNQIVDGKPKVLDKVCLRTFLGAVDEFDMPSITNFADLNTNTINTVACELKQDQLTMLVWQQANFGDFGNTSTNTALRIDLSDNIVSVYCKQAIDPNFFLRSTAIVESTEQFTWVIYGTHFSKLSALEDPVVFFVDQADYLEVISASANLLIPKQRLDGFKYLEPIATYFENGQDDICEIQWNLGSKRFAEALNAQKPGKNSTNRHITIKDCSNSLALGKQEDLLRREFSEVDLFFKEYMGELTEADETIVLASSTGLIKSLKVLKYCVSTYKLDVDELRMTLYYRDSDYGKRWVLQLTFPSLDKIPICPMIAGGVRIAEK